MVPLRLSETRVHRFLVVCNTATSNKPGLDSEVNLISTLKTAGPLTIGAAWHGACPAITTRNCARRSAHGFQQDVTHKRDVKTD
jgi:hypothetical protein